MTSITITITAKCFMTMTTTNTIETLVLHSGDKAHWAKLIGGDYGDSMKAGILEIVNGKTFTKVYAGKEQGTFTKSKRNIELLFRANA